jgi:hypothetical protein
MVSKVVAFLVLAVLTLSTAGRAEAQPADYRTYFTFSAPVTLPGITLPAGKYIFRLADPSSTRKVINVLSGDGKQSLAMLHTIPDQATRAPKDAEIRFMETSANVPPPIKTWWYPGKAIGYEFIYPRKQALELAKSTPEPVLTTAQETTDFGNADLSRVSGNENQTAVTVEETPAPREASGRAQTGNLEAPQSASAAPSPSQGGASTSAGAPRDTRADESARSTARTELPRTAGSVPAVAVLGALALSLGLGLSRRARTRA